MNIENRKLSFAAACMLFAFGFVSAAVLAQSAQRPAPPQEQPVVIHSGTVHTVSGETYDDGYVAFEEGVITAVGSGEMLSAPEDAEMIDAGGLHVYPGLIGSHTSLGLSEISAVDVTVDTNEYGRISPEVRAAVAINPDTELVPVARANGILTALVFPRGGLVSGRSSIVRLDGWTWEDMAIDAEAGLVIHWPRTEPISASWMEKSTKKQEKEIEKSLREIDELFNDAEAYVAAVDSDPQQPHDLRFEAMRPILAGDSPVFVHANRQGEIESAVAWGLRRELKLVIVGGRNADETATLLNSHDIPVIIGGTHRLPRRRDADVHEPFTLPDKLHEAGVRFAIASGEAPAHERNLNHNAATAAAYGLPKAQALRSVTLSAAEIIGIGETHGSIDKGKAATLIITTGDPLEVTTDTLHAFIDGRKTDLGNRHKRLYKKYKEKYRQLGLIEE